MRFVVLGAVGFGVAGAIGGTLLFPLGLLLAGALGGAMLGLASKNLTRVLVLAVLGALGLNTGIFVGLALGSFINYAEVPIAAVVGAVLGAWLGVAFRDWTILALAVAGAVGFSVGLWAGDYLRFHLAMLRGLGEAGSIIVSGLVGGASLGAALGYLESRKSASERSPRVR
jgi:hypothetical protein